MHARDRFRGCLLGLATGDAVGTALEFRPRGSFEPLTDMQGGGPFGLLPGQWTDDTSMALCMATSLVERGGFDARDQMARYCRWADHGYLSSTGACFDIGKTVAAALRRFKLDGNPYAGSDDPNSAGNGCIMRLAPIPMYFGPELLAVERFAAEQMLKHELADAKMKLAERKTLERAKGILMKQKNIAEDEAFQLLRR